MSDPHYQIHEMDDGRYEVLDLGVEAPITIKQTLEEARRWVLKMEGHSSPDPEA